MRSWVGRQVAWLSNQGSHDATSPPKPETAPANAEDMRVVDRGTVLGDCVARLEDRLGQVRHSA